MRLQRRLDRRAQDAGLDARGAANRVHFEHAVQAPHVEADGARITIADDRLDASHHRRTGAKGNDGDSCAARPVEQCGNVSFRLGQRDEIRRVGEVAGEGAHGLRVRLAVGVEQPFVRVLGQNGSERGGRRDARAPERDVGDLRRRGCCVLRDAELVGGEAEHALTFGLIEAFALMPPAVEFESRRHDVFLISRHLAWRQSPAKATVDRRGLLRLSDAKPNPCTVLGSLRSADKGPAASLRSRLHP